MEEQHYPTADGNLVRFRTIHVLSKNGTAANDGVETHDQETVAVIVSPGAPKSEAVIPVHRKYWNGEERRQRGYARFKPQYEAWLGGLEGGTFGTPIVTWDDISDSDKQRLRSHKITTIESLAMITDTAIQHLGMGARDLVAKAKAYASRGGSRAVSEIRRENDQLRTLLEQALTRLDALEAAAGGRKSAPRRVAETAPAETAGL